MRKRYYALLGIALTSLFITTIMMTFAAENKYIYRTATPEEVQTFFLKIEDLGPVRGVRVVKPDFTYEYVDDERTLAPDTGYQYGSYHPYAVSIRINTLSPSDYMLTVTIKINGVVKWSGGLGAGQSSPTITANGGTIYVRVLNQNDVSIHYACTITLIYN
ncbi:MAG: hypothetical protein ACUVV4_06270 [Candidatus Bathyarchaeia archaeon]